MSIPISEAGLILKNGKAFLTDGRKCLPITNKQCENLKDKQQLIIKGVSMKIFEQYKNVFKALADGDK